MVMFCFSFLVFSFLVVVVSQLDDGRTRQDAVNANSRILREREKIIPKTEMIIFHDPRCTEYSAPGHPERPERLVRTVPLLQDRHRDWEWRQPRPASKEE